MIIIIICYSLLSGHEEVSGFIQGFVKEPWFIATLIGTIGGTLWFALCVFSIWIYRKRRARKKLHKNGVISVPVHKADDPRAASYYNHDSLLKDNHRALPPG